MVGSAIAEVVGSHAPGNRWQITAEATQTVRYPDNEIAWSGIILEYTAADSGEPAQGYFTTLISNLRQRCYDVVEAALLPRIQQRVGTISCIAATIEADRFAIYRCIDEAAATRVAADVGHAIQEGAWVLRSIPVLMYADPHYEMGQLPDDRIAWSRLLQNETFRSDLKASVEQLRTGSQ